MDLDFPKGVARGSRARPDRPGGRALQSRRTAAARESIVTIFRAPDNPPPPEIKGLSGDMARMMGKHEKLLSPAAMEDFFGEVYWRVGAKGLDAKAILEDFRIGSGETDFSYRTVAEKFRMIESGMVPVIVPRDEKARDAVAKLGIEKIPSGAIARDLQTYIVQVPPRARARLIERGHVKFSRSGCAATSSRC